MKKILFVCVAIAAGVLFSNNSSAQTTKIGYFDEQAALSLFPGINKIDTLLNSYRLDSLQEEYKYTVSDFQRRDSIFKKDSATMPAKARELATKELFQLRYKLVNWQQYQQHRARRQEEGIQEDAVRIAVVRDAAGRAGDGIRPCHSGRLYSHAQCHAVHAAGCGMAARDC